MELWDKTKKWADENRVVAGALGGGVAGSVIPGIGTIAGAVGGALVGFMSHKDKEPRQPDPPPGKKPK